MAKKPHPYEGNTTNKKRPKSELVANLGPYYVPRAQRLDLWNQELP
tara:strand:+ start:311 stop:448 length:138 start_codon:yes stop_codon:yes gene_type:complete